MAIQDYLGGLNIFGTPIPTGILDPKQEEKLRNQALVSGIIGTAANYLAQPKNLNAGSALPYLAKAYIGGMGASQGTVDTALNNLYRQQLLAGRNDPFGTVDISKFTPESISEFQKTKDYGVLKPVSEARGTNIGNIDPTKFKFGSITNGGVSIATSFKSKSKDDADAKKKEIPLDPFMTPDEQQRQLQYVKANPAEFTDFDIPWSLTVSYSFQFSRIIKPDYSGFKLQTYSSLNFNGDFSLTPKWKLGGTGYVDVAKASIQQLSMFITREMHCWQLSINVTPIGMYRSFSITVNPKSGILRDLKINRSRTFSSSTF